ncbi:P-loop containing nucleoside triphosphate hydrolase protein [Lentinula lateritia]|nr:P-loop containing nucleoside triphosphate hydrolase protein [Lentinula lateritia]
MSSDAYSNDDIDDETFEQLNAIEAQYQQSTEQRPVSARAPSPISIDSSDYGEFIDLDESALDALKAIEDGRFQQLPRKAAPSLARTSSKGTLQTTLFGEVIPAGSSTTRPKPHALRTRSKQEPRKTKRWDHTAFAKTGVKTGNARGKGKKKQQDEDEEGEEEEEFEFEQFPPPFVSPLKFFQPPPRKIQLDLLEAKHWIFPLNRPKRDYQFDIVRNSLFENTIVALPTGTGKTFIAGVVMLNYYRWFPEGKVVFVAPTRPLVSQQIEACHEACGIPGSDAIEMTGQVSKPIRHKFWGQKRVFYMTPQTLINDLQSENCDARDIVLLVVDEAHRATGDYAYNQVIRYMMAKNPHFRVLALTATPGGNKEAVQTLIDGLHISHIEIRAERELARYNHVKEIEQHVISMTPEINRIKNLFLKLMDSFFKPIAHIWRGSPNLMRMHPFAATSLAASLAQGQRHLCGPLYTLSSFARWLGYLMEGTVKMCYDDLEAYAPKATKAKKVHTNPLFLSLMNEIRAQNAQGFKMHPKMEKMKNLIMQHFGARMSEDGDPESGEGATKAMVFVTHRAAVDEIVEVLNAEQPLIRATPFIGQGTDKKGKKGLAQREQLEIIKKFKNNEFNILVATSIGEEGLDIGEVDLAICYDTQKTPIRLLQRLGRTGRKRSGHVHVLLADGREEANFDKAQSSYEDVQTSIIYGSHLEFYADVERLLPDNVQPQCLEKEMEIIPYVRDEAPKKRDNSPKKGVKRKRNDDIGRNIPQGASTGFVSVADLLVKEKGGKKAKKIREPKNFEALGEDDEDDLELASGIFGAPPALKKSKSASAPRPKAGTSMLRKSKTLDPNKPKRSKKGKGKEKEKEEAPPPPSEWTASQLQAKGVDDSDDLEIENGVPTTKTKTLSPRRSSSEQAVVDAEVIDLTDSNREASGKLPLFQYPRLSPSRNDQNIAWLLEDEDEDVQLDFDIVNSSPVVERTQQPLEPDNSVLDLDDSDSSPGRGPSQCRMSVDDSLEFMDDVSSPTRSAYTRVSSLSATPVDDSIKFMQYGSSPPPPSQVRNGGWFSTRQEAIKHSNTATKAPPTQSKIFRDDMLPPGLPNSPVGSSSISIHASPQAPEPSFAVKPVGKKRITTLAFTSSSPSIESPVQTHRRLHRRPESSGSEMPPPTIPGIKRSQDKHKRRKRPRVPMKYKPLYDYEAIHSGDEESEGSSGSEDVESESDRMFLEELPETQASPSYDQSLAYRQSLLTQAPDGGPSFASKPVRKGRFGRNSIRTQNSNRRRPGVSSSPTMEDETDLYELGSFVVSDDAEISYEV